MRNDSLEEKRRQNMRNDRETEILFCTEQETYGGRRIGVRIRETHLVCQCAEFVLIIPLINSLITL